MKPPRICRSHHFVKDSLYWKQFALKDKFLIRNAKVSEFIDNYHILLVFRPVTTASNSFQNNSLWPTFSGDLASPWNQPHNLTSIFFPFFLRHIFSTSVSMYVCIIPRPFTREKFCVYSFVYLRFSFKIYRVGVGYIYINKVFFIGVYFIGIYAICIP